MNLSYAGSAPAQAAAAAASAPKAGIPWEVWLIVAAVVVPVVLVIGAAVGIFLWMRSRMKKSRIIYIRKSGEIKISDYSPDKPHIDIEEGRHTFRPGQPKNFLVSLFGWKQPVHIFKQGTSAELTIDQAKIYAGNDNRNSEYLAAYVKTERAKQLFALTMNLGFSIVLAIAAGAVGILAGMAISHFMGKTPAEGATKAAVTTTIPGR